MKFNLKKKRFSEVHLIFLNWLIFLTGSYKNQYYCELFLSVANGIKIESFIIL